MLFFLQNPFTKQVTLQLPRELQTSQPHLHLGKGDGAAYPGGHHQASGAKEGYQK